MQECEVSLLQVIDHFTNQQNNTIKELILKSLEFHDQLEYAKTELKSALKKAEKDETMYKDRISQLLIDAGKSTKEEMESAIHKLVQYLIEIQITCQEKMDKLFKPDMKSDGEQKEDDCRTLTESIIYQTRCVLGEYMQQTKEDAQKKIDNLNELLQKSKEKNQEYAQIINKLNEQMENYKKNSSYAQRQSVCIPFITKIQKIQVYLEEIKCGKACRLAIDVYSLLNEDIYSITQSKRNDPMQMFYTEVGCSMQTLLGCSESLLTEFVGMYIAFKKQNENLCCQFGLSSMIIDAQGCPEVSNS